MSKKRCAVCGDRCATNVRLKWRRDSDGKTVNVCMMCAETGKVNAESINNFQTKDTLAEAPVENSTKPGSPMSAYYRTTSRLGVGHRANTRKA